MQDDSKYNYDPELADRGWSMLEKQLDEVLPQQPQRRLFWFWIPLLLGVSTLAGAGMYVAANQGVTKDNIPETSPTIELNARPIASAEQNVSDQTVDVEMHATAAPSIETATTSRNEGSINSSSRTNTELTLDPPASSMLILAPEEVYTDSGTSIVEAERFTPTDLEQTNTNTTITTAATKGEEVVKIDELGHTPEQTVHASFEHLSTVGKVASLPSPTMALLEEEIASLGELTILDENRGKWRGFAEGQFTLALGEQSGLLGGGAGIERKLGDSWSIGLGLFYEQSQQSLSTDDIALDLNQADEVVVNNSAAYNINEATEAISYDRFKTELQAHYQLHPRWRVGGGFSLAYFRQAVLNTSDIALSSEFSGGGIGLSEPARVDESYNLFDDPVTVYEFDTMSNAAVGPFPLEPKRWQLAGMLSVQYQISKTWAVNMNYRRDLTKWQSADVDFGTPSFAQFGLRYYFR